MINKQYMWIENNKVFRFYSYSADRKEMATGHNCNKGESVTLVYDGKDYHFYDRPCIVKRESFGYPFVLDKVGKNTFGYEVKSRDETVLRYYPQAAVIEKKFLFSKKLWFMVYEYQGELYLRYRVGFPKENSHFYCLKDIHGKTVAIAERHTFTEDSLRVTLYVEDEKYYELALLMSACETMKLQRNGAEVRGVIDPSAGHYISIQEEERKELDRDFIARVKAMENQ